MTPEEQIRSVAAKKMYSVGAPGVTLKTTVEAYDDTKQRIVEYDSYTILAWTLPGRLDYIDVIVSRLHSHKIRALVERICSNTRVLLRHGIWTIDDIIDDWRGARFEPAGTCPQIVGLLSGETMGKVLSPLDAIAQVLDLRKDSWNANDNLEVHDPGERRADAGDAQGS